MASLSPAVSPQGGPPTFVDHEDHERGQWRLTVSALGARDEVLATATATAAAGARRAVLALWLAPGTAREGVVAGSLARLAARAAARGCTTLTADVPPGEEDAARAALVALGHGGRPRAGGYEIDTRSPHPLAAPIRQVIVPLDGSRVSDRALAAADDLARAAAAPLVLVSWDPAADPARRRRLRRTAISLGAATVIDAGRDDDPAAAVHALVAAQPASVVCLATHGRGTIRAAAHASVSEEILRRCGAPVLLVGPSIPRDGLGRGPVVVAAGDAATAARAMPAAAGLAAATGAAVLTLEVAAHDGLPGWSEAREHTVVTDRDPARAIVAYAAAVDAGAVAMATRARTGPSRAIAGSIALQVARHAPCPVLLVHIEEVRP